MKINVPFYKSVKDTDCGPIVLKMVLEYFGKKCSLQEISKFERQLDTGLVWSLGIARAAVKLGLESRVISTTNFSHDENIDYYEKYKGDKGMIVLEELKDEAEKLGIKTEEKNLLLGELLSLISENSILIVLVNWNVIKGIKDYQGHFLVLTGYDEENIYVHNPGIDRVEAYMPIKKNLFIKMWESPGTDKDLIVIYKNLKQKDL